MTASRYPRLRDDLMVRQIDGDTVVYDPVADRTAILNPSAAGILGLCDGSRSEDEIAMQTAARFDPEGGRITADVAAALRDFSAQGLFVQDSNAPS